MYEIRRTAKYKKDYKLMKKQGKDMTLLNDVTRILANGQKLPKGHLEKLMLGELTHLLPSFFAQTLGESTKDSPRI